MQWIPTLLALMALALPGAVRAQTQTPAAYAGVGLPADHNIAEREEVSLTALAAPSTGGCPHIAAEESPGSCGALTRAAGIDALPPSPATSFMNVLDLHEALRSVGVTVKFDVDLLRTESIMGPVPAVVASAARQLRLPDVVLTSGQEGPHKEGSLHPLGKALDFRGWSMTAKQGQAWAALVRAQLGRDYDVIFEAFLKSPGRNHLHVEFDPEP